MAKYYKFIYDSGYVGGRDVTEIMKFKDDISEKTVEEELNSWYQEKLDSSAYYEEITEEEAEGLRIDCDYTE